MKLLSLLLAAMSAITVYFYLEPPIIVNANLYIIPAVFGGLSSIITAMPPSKAKE